MYLFFRGMIIKGAHDMVDDDEKEESEAYGDVVPCGLTIRVLLLTNISKEREPTLPKYVVRSITLSKSLNYPNQRENLFYSKCLIKGYVCSLIMDGES